jgi:hypothetical protein
MSLPEKTRNDLPSVRLLDVVDCEANELGAEQAARDQKRQDGAAAFGFKRVGVGDIQAMPYQI